MAEAAVDGAPMPRFFCHRCSVEIQHLLPDYICPHCSTGFIEEVDARGNDGGTDMDISSEELSDAEGDASDYGFQRSNRDELRELFFELSEASGAMASGMAAPPGVVGGSNSGRSGTQGGERHALGNDPRNPGRGGLRQVMGLPIDHLIQDFIFNLSGWGVPVGQGQTPVLFLGNPGDYVWGRDGLDAIVTQLLNQMEGTGPPPLPREQIDQIPSTTVTQEQVDVKLQCSVCWEDFRLAEPVRQLPCQHFYHAPCIVPWLELHGTCPICRQSLGDQNSVEANQDTVAPNLAAFFQGSQ
ncbi:E3 ubiquitin-protein ligase Iruka isoform X2 [Athalia rosae]|uniref:E3 ubiquitin-protein ligase Iruka isoform X2 n=1 Tax=Athalia rosae TaxID=37344 RepID=UPI0020332A03|nr:E3 ubiquitin-protein ligase Iruka isoform X2 [Athalia rosae]